MKTIPSKVVASKKKLIVPEDFTRRLLPFGGSHDAVNENRERGLYSGDVFFFWLFIFLSRNDK